MIKKIRDILQSGLCLSDFTDKCKNDGACRKCEDEALEKLIAEHNAEVIDEFVNLLKEKVDEDTERFNAYTFTCIDEVADRLKEQK